MPKVKNIGSSAFEIREEIVRWDSVKTAHDLYDDMEVARMLLDCYDLIGGHFLVWSDEAKLAPPPLYATLRLQHVSEEGWQILQEIKALGAWTEKKNLRNTSRRKQGKVRRIYQVGDAEEAEEEDVDVDEDDYFYLYGLSEEEECHDSQDEDYDPALDEDCEPEPEVKSPKRKRGGFLRAPRQIKKEEDDAGLQEKEDSEKKDNSDEDAFAEEVEIKTEQDGEDSQPTTVLKKRGRPKKGEVRPKPVKGVRKRAKKKKKHEKKNWGRYAKVSTVYQCTLCETSKESPDEFKEHYMTHKDAENTSEETKEADASEAIRPRRFHLERDATILFRCLACNEILKHKDEHRKLHDRNRRPMVCHLCGKILGSVETWRKHIQTHEAKMSGVQIMCKVCGKSFPIVASLKSHMRSHSRERPHICDSCGKAFKTQYHLDRHLLIHIPVKPLTCSYCNKGFNNESNLKGHIRIHTGEKPYKCDLCPMAFTHNVSLKSHKKSAHGIDMWKIQSVGSSLECDDLFQKSAVPDPLAKQEEVKAGVDDNSKNSVAKKMSTDLDELSLQQAIHSISTGIQGEPPASQNPVAMGTSEGMSSASGSASQETDHQSMRPATPEERCDKSIPITSSYPAFILPRGEQPLILPRGEQPLILPRGEQPHAQIQPYPTLQPPQAAASDYITINRGPPFNMPDVGMSQSAQDYWEAAKRTFTKL